jgi:hypothetical protein
MIQSVFSSFVAPVLSGTRSSRGFARVAFLLCVAALPMASAMFRVWVYQDTVRFGYALSVQQQTREVLLARLHELEVEHAAARTPARLVRVAQKLGLQPPRPGQLVGGAAAPHLAQAELGANF